MQPLGTNGNALFGLRTRSQPVDAESLYLWQNGVLEEMGPQVPPGSLIGEPRIFLVTRMAPTGEKSGGVSRDATHVVYQVRSPSSGGHDYLWPFDQTSDGEFNSVYEYAGTGHTQPLLVAVTGGQGSNSLIGGCGAWFGQKFNQNIRNAVSADGSTVFVTVQGEDSLGGPRAGPVPAPAHTEIYARVDGEKASAHTVAISEPSAADCSACQTGSRLEATFEGASEDGSKGVLPHRTGTAAGEPGPQPLRVRLRRTGRAEGDRGLTHGLQRGGPGPGSDQCLAGRLARLLRRRQRADRYGKRGRRHCPGGGKQPLRRRHRNGKLLLRHHAGRLGLGIVEQGGRGARGSATPDGRFLLFGSNAQVTPDNTSTVSPLFRYDAASGELARISIGEGGFNDNGNTSTDPAAGPRNFSHSDAYAEVAPPQRAMSDDGSRVFFQSTNGLTPQAANHVPVPGFPEHFVRNIYEYRAGHVYLISNGLDLTAPSAGSEESSVKLMGTTSSGDDVFFTTANSLIPTDKDTVTDVYDARVGGGSRSLPARPARGESCQGLAGAAPPSTRPATSSFSRAGKAEAAPQEETQGKAPQEGTQVPQVTIRRLQARRVEVIRRHRPPPRLRP